MSGIDTYEQFNDKDVIRILDLNYKIIEYQISISWDGEVVDGPTVYCEGAHSGRLCENANDLEEAINQCIFEKLSLV